MRALRSEEGSFENDVLISAAGSLAAPKLEAAGFFAASALEAALRSAATAGAAARFLLAKFSFSEAEFC